MPRPTHTRLPRRPSGLAGAVAMCLAAVGLAPACSGGQSTGTTGAFTTLGPTAGADSSGGDAETEADLPGEGSGGGSSSSTGDGPQTTASTGGDDGPTTGQGATTGASSTTDVEPVDPQPRTGWWSHCVPGISCGDGLVCMVDETEMDGTCTSQCTPAGDASSCGPSPGGTSTPICLTVSTNSICALDCSDGKTCPGGMICLSDMDDTGPIEICI